MNVSQNPSMRAVDLLIYRGEKYKENRLKKKQELGEKEYDQCTFKPELNPKSKIIRDKSGEEKKSYLQQVKEKMTLQLQERIGIKK